MKHRQLPVGLLLASHIALAAALPADVETFIKNRDSCDHFRGEPFDAGNGPKIKAHREFISWKIEQHCTGTDQELARLRQKYRDNQPVSQRLSDYEDRIEAPPNK